MKFFSFVFCLYFFLLPLQLALSPVEGVDLASIRVITMLLVGIWLVFSLVSRKILFPDLIATFFLTGFLLLSFGSILWSENGGFALRKSLFFLSFFPLFFIFSSLFKEKSETRTLFLKYFVFGAGILAVIGITLFLLQFLLGIEKVFIFLVETVLPLFLGPAFAQSVATHPSLLVNIAGETILRASGVFPDPHMFSLYLGMALPVTIGFFLEEPFLRQKRAWTGLFLVLLLGVLLSFSRGAYVAIVAGLSILFFVSGAWRSLGFSQKWAGLAGGLLFLVILSLSPIGSRFFSSFSQEDGSNIERVRLLKEAVGYISERPFLGVGLGNYPLLVKPSATYRDPIYAHNLFLDVALELGLVGLFLLLGLFTRSFLALFCYWKKTKSWQSLCLGSGMIIFLVHGIFEAPLFSVHILPIIILFLTIGVSYRYDAKYSS